MHKRGVKSLDDKRKSPSLGLQSAVGRVARLAQRVQHDCSAGVLRGPLADIQNTARSTCDPRLPLRIERCCVLSHLHAPQVSIWKQAAAGRRGREQGERSGGAVTVRRVSVVGYPARSHATRSSKWTVMFVRCQVSSPLVGQNGAVSGMHEVRRHRACRRGPQARRHAPMEPRAAALQLRQQHQHA